MERQAAYRQHAGMPKPAATFAIAALSVDLTAGGDVAPKAFRLLPYGRFKAADGSGRPDGIPEGWLLDREAAVVIAAAFNGRSDARVIDYEHQTLHAETNGKPAPAAGWIGRLEARDDGLYAVDVEWTAAAAEMITAKPPQYRYISPVFPYDKRTGRVLAIAHAALTNFAGLDGLTDLAAMSALAAKFSHHVVQPEEEMPMKALLAALGLPEAATEAEALAALNALKTAHTGDLAALRAKSTEAPDPAKFVEVATLTAVRGELAAANTALAALKAEKHEAEVGKVVTAALAAGKLTPAMEGWAKSLGKADLAALNAFVEKAPVVVTPGETQTGGKGGGEGKSHQLSDVDTAVMKAMGLTAEQFAAGKQEA